MKYSKKHIFYVYALLDTRKKGPFFYGHWKFDYEPFYIGKGTGERINDHINGYGTNSLKNNIIAKIIKETGDNHLSIIKRNKLTEKQAFTLEKRLIFIIGMRVYKEGPLSNLSVGGSGGSSGYIFTKKQSDNLSKLRKGRIFTEEHKQNLRGHFSEEHKRKIGIGNSGKIRSNKVIKQQRIYKNVYFKGYCLISPDFKVYTIGCLKHFSKKYSIDRSSLVAVANGYRQTAGGWRCFRISNKNKIITTSKTEKDVKTLLKGTDISKVTGFYKLRLIKSTVDRNIRFKWLLINIESKKEHKVINLIKFSKEIGLDYRLLYWGAKGLRDNSYKGWKCFEL